MEGLVADYERMLLKQELKGKDMMKLPAMRHKVEYLNYRLVPLTNTCVPDLAAKPYWIAYKECIYLFQGGKEDAKRWWRLLTEAKQAAYEVAVHLGTLNTMNEMDEYMALPGRERWKKFIPCVNVATLLWGHNGTPDDINEAIEEVEEECDYIFTNVEGEPTSDDDVDEDMNDDEDAAK